MTIAKLFGPDDGLDANEIVHRGLGREVVSVSEIRRLLHWDVNGEVDARGRALLIRSIEGVDNVVVC